MSLKNLFFILLSLTIFAGCIILYFYISANLPTILFRINPKHVASKEEKELLQKGRRNPSNGDFQALYNAMLKKAVQTPYVEVGQCSPYPLFTKVILYNYLTFKNSDTKDHTLKFTDPNTVTISAHSSKSIKIDFYRLMPAPFGYYCDDLINPVGILFIVPKY